MGPAETGDGEPLALQLCHKLASVNLGTALGHQCLLKLIFRSVLGRG